MFEATGSSKSNNLTQFSYKGRNPINGRGLPLLLPPVYQLVASLVRRPVPKKVTPSGLFPVPATVSAVSWIGRPVPEKVTISNNEYSTITGIIM